MSIGSVVADSPPSKPADELRDRVARLISDLDADSRATRNQAEQELQGLGSQVLPHLPAPDLLPTAATRDAVQRVRTVLEQRKARESVEASRVTIQGSIPLQKLFASISVQTGNEINARALPENILGKKFSAEFDQVPFWRAIDTIAEREQLLMAEGTPGTLQLRVSETPRHVTLPKGIAGRQPVQPGEIAVQTIGAFRVALRSAAMRPLIVKNSSPVVRFQLGLLAEPRLRPLFLTYATADFSAGVKSGMRWNLTSPKARLELPAGEGTGRWNVPLDFNVPADAPLEQADFRGKVKILTSAAPERFVFDRFPEAKQQSRRRGGVVVRIDDVVLRKTRESAFEAVVQIVVSYDSGGPAFESHRSWILQNEAWIENFDRRRFEFEGAPLIRRQEDGSVVVEYRFASLPRETEKLRFIYVAPTLLIDVPIEFQFSDIVISNTDRKDAAP